MVPPEKTGPDPLQLGGGGGYGPEERNPYHLIGDGRRLYRYGKAKAATLRVLDAVGDEAAKGVGLRVASMRACGQWLLFRHFPTRQETKLKSANFCCTHLVCGFCAIRRGARMMARYLERFQWIRAKHPELRPYLVTLTVRNGEDLAERLKHLERCLTRLHKRRQGKRTQSLMALIQGAVWSYEVTYSERNGWHPHVHAVWLAQEQPDMHALRAEWEGITGDSFMCDVRPIEPEAGGATDGKAPEGAAAVAAETTTTIDPYAKGFAEVFKYALKAAELPAAQVLRAFQTLRGKRLVRAFGEFYGVKEPDGFDLADELPADDLPYIDLLFHYAGGERYEFVESTSSSTGCGGGGDAPDLPPAAGQQVSTGGDGRSGRPSRKLRGAVSRQLERVAQSGKETRPQGVFPAVSGSLRLQASRGSDAGEGSDTAALHGDVVSH